MLRKLIYHFLNLDRHKSVFEKNEYGGNVFSLYESTRVLRLITCRLVEFRIKVFDRRIYATLHKILL